jgi:hypothetical protein
LPVAKTPVIAKDLLKPNAPTAPDA